MNSPPQAPDSHAMYRCVGLVRGQYFPSEDALTQGFVLTDDGCKFPAVLLGQIAKWLTANPEQLQQSHIWLVWPRQRHEPPNLFLQLVRVGQPVDERQHFTTRVNYFSVRGVVQSQKDGRLSIRIERNYSPPKGKEKAKRWKPFVMVVEGYLPESACGQFWELDCYREGERLIMEDARPIQEVPQAQGKLNEPDAGVPAQEAPKNPVSIPKSSAIKAYSASSAQQGDAMPISGKLELTVKINSSPDEVKTIENGWKQFDVDTDAQVVTITLKPKTFKKLEQAQADYPQWVAAIAGKLGDRTHKGFILLEPNIQVFERKPKEVSQEKEEAVAPVS